MTVKGGNNRNIKDFFKPFTVPKNRIPVNDTIGDEIIVAALPKRPTSTSGSEQRLGSNSPTKRGPGRPRKDSPTSSKSSTPTKRSANGTPKKRSSPVSKLKGAAEDDGLIHISPASSQRRPLQAVEIVAPPPPPPQFKSASRSTTASFSSISTLSSMLLSSQSSSKRTIKGGIMAVTNSDSGSADSDSDELADVTSFVKRRKISPPSEDVSMTIPSTVQPKRRSGRLLDEDRRRTTPKMMPSPPRTVYKHSLANMIKLQQKADKNEEKVRDAETAFREAKKRREAAMEREAGLAGDLAGAMADDSDEGARVKLAIARTEALQDEQLYFYFRCVRTSTRDAVFPSRPGTVWERYRDNDNARTQAFLSGFIAQLADSDSFIDEISDWIIRSLPLESREDLCEAYVEVLRVRSTARAFAQHTAPHLSDFYTFSNTLRRDENQAQSMADTPLKADDSLTGLRYALRGIRNAYATAHYDDPASVALTVSELIPALVDRRVASNPNLLAEVVDSIEHIVDHPSERSSFEKLCKHIQSVFLEVTDVPLTVRCRAVAALTARSERTHQLRRMLALHLVGDRFTAQDYITNRTSSQMVVTILSRLKTSPEFAIKESSDYLALYHIIAVLDIAIDAGFSDFSFRHQSVQTSKPINAFAKASPAATAEAEFNATVDALTNQLRLMCSRIRDAGTTHLRRTEAKSAIEQLILRLDFCVRTKPKARKGIFGDGINQQQDLLSGFLKPAGVAGDEGSNVLPVTLLDERKDEAGHAGHN